MAEKYKINPFTGQLDDVGMNPGYNGYDGTSAPSQKGDGFMDVVVIAGTAFIYFFAGGQRCRVALTPD